MDIKLYGRDPRTVAREISGIFDSIFPYLIPGIVSNINKLCEPMPGLEKVPERYWMESKLQKAMLFEITLTHTESKLEEEIFPGWEEIIERAIKKQKFYYDAQSPKSISHADKLIIELVSQNLIKALDQYARKKQKTLKEITIKPKIPGFSWIASGAGDFSLGNDLIEVKCSSKNFSSADYRQVLMYWLLSYLNAIEKDGNEWEICTLINPRLNTFLEISFDELIEITSPLGSKIELIENFRATIDLETHN